MDHQSVIDEIVRRAGAPDIEAINEELASTRRPLIISVVFSFNSPFQQGKRIPNFKG